MHTSIYIFYIIIFKKTIDRLFILLKKITYYNNSFFILTNKKTKYEKIKYNNTGNTENNNKYL